MDEIIDQLIRKEMGRYEDDYEVHCGSKWLAELIRSLMKEVVKNKS